MAMTQEEVDKGVDAAARIGAETASEALKAPGVIKKKKKKNPGIVQNVKNLYGAGKALYNKYMAGRKEMQETRPKPGVRKIEPKPPGEEMEKPIATQPPKKKKGKPRGGVGGVIDKIEERKRRQKEALDL